MPNRCPASASSALDASGAFSTVGKRAHDEDRSMTLQAKLDAFKADFEAGKPP